MKNKKILKSFVFVLGAVLLTLAVVGVALFSSNVKAFSPTVDSDGDGIFDSEDNCPFIFNPFQTDLDEDHTGDACDSSILVNKWEEFTFVLGPDPFSHSAPREIIQMQGTATLAAGGELLVNTRQPNGHTGGPGAPIQTEIVSMSLTGDSTLLGPISMSGSGSGSFTPLFQPSPLETLAFPADAFFDVFFEIEAFNPQFQLPPQTELPLILEPLQPKHEYGLIKRWPPLFGNPLCTDEQSPIALVDHALGETPIGYMMYNCDEFSENNESHQTAYPPNGTDFNLDLEAELNIEIFNSGFLDTVVARGQGSVDRSNTIQPGPGAAGQVDIELVSMSLSGHSLGLGDVEIRTSSSPASQGQTQSIHNNPPATLPPTYSAFPAESFFDVFFEIELVDMDLTLKPMDEGGNNPVPLRLSATPGIKGFPFPEGTIFCSLDEPSILLFAVGPPAPPVGQLNLGCIEVPPPPPPVFCGDDSVNQPGEECDGADDDACPGQCFPPGDADECACPEEPPVFCGDGAVNQPTEECDAPDDILCPGQCGAPSDPDKCLCPDTPENWYDVGDAASSWSHDTSPDMDAYPDGAMANYPVVIDPQTNMGPYGYGLCHVPGPAYLATRSTNTKTYELDADLTPDQDGLTNIDPPGASDRDEQPYGGDDGLVLPVDFSAGGEQEITINGNDDGETMYVNAWFDWNRDGDWADTGLGPIPESFVITRPAFEMPPEWALVNYETPDDGDFSITPIIQTPPIGIEAPIWIRVTLSDTPLDSPYLTDNGSSFFINTANAQFFGDQYHYAGGQETGCFDDGETEDYLFDPDLDDDGVLNHEDNCPEDANPDQADSDDDGTGDACEDGGGRRAYTLCENNLAEFLEDCDGADLNGETCVSLGYNSGSLACDSGCNFDTSDCVSPTFGAAPGDDDFTDLIPPGFDETGRGAILRFLDLFTGLVPDSLVAFAGDVGSLIAQVGAMLDFQLQNSEQAQLIVDSLEELNDDQRADLSAYDLSGYWFTKLFESFVYYDLFNNGDLDSGLRSQYLREFNRPNADLWSVPASYELVSLLFYSDKEDPYQIAKNAGVVKAGEGRADVMSYVRFIQFFMDVVFGPAAGFDAESFTAELKAQNLLKSELWSTNQPAYMAEVLAAAKKHLPYLITESEVHEAAEASANTALTVATGSDEIFRHFAKDQGLPKRRQQSLESRFVRLMSYKADGQALIDKGLIDSMITMLEAHPFYFEIDEASALAKTEYHSNNCENFSELSEGLGSLIATGEEGAVFTCTLKTHDDDAVDMATVYAILPANSYVLTPQLPNLKIIPTAGGEGFVFQTQFKGNPAKTLVFNEEEEQRVGLSVVILSKAHQFFLQNALAGLLFTDNNANKLYTKGTPAELGIINMAIALRNLFAPVAKLEGAFTGYGYGAAYEQ